MDRGLVFFRKILIANVPKFIEHIKSKGGVSKDEWLWLGSDIEEPIYPKFLIINADQFLIAPRNVEIWEQSVFVIVLAIAIMSFIPGGVTCFDTIFDVNLEGYHNECET